MSNRKDNSPSLDYFELRRRHEAYKNREKQAAQEQTPEARPVRNTEPAAEPVYESEAEPLEPNAVLDDAGAEAYAESLPEANTDAGDDAGDDGYTDDGEYTDEGEYADEGDYADEDGEYPEDDGDYGDDYADEDAEEDENANPNPFDPFIKAFHGIRSRFSRKRKGGGDEDYE